MSNPVHPGPVANQFPKRTAPHRIAFIGEAPGEEEVRLGYPFAGNSGWMLNTALSQAGLSREEVFVGNVSQYKPSVASNDFSIFNWNDGLVQHSIAQLLQDLATFAPNIVVCLGNVPLHLLKQGNVPPPRTDSGYNWPSKVTAWRGSLFLSNDALFKPISAQPQLHGVSACVVQNGGTAHETEPPPGTVGETPLNWSSDSGADSAALPTPGQLPLAAPTGAESSLHEHLPPVPPDSAAHSPPPGPGVGSRTDWPLSAGDGSRASMWEPSSSLSGGSVPIVTPLPAPRYKCLATWHPAFVCRVYTKLFDLRMDLLRARDEGRSPHLHLDELDIRWGPGVEALT